ncbi:ATP-binding protein [Chryseobacterium shigense]|uniref:histidine kinase n=1 Tax=Chryseobacterium shigense TaxID=297244 RepID=A0A841N213_9FLAO|nr:ATP-binding protein [Chryseobacterium shigense]MBB6369183.1 signal transduction histidine kinase [Chryseobacterium shigense]
MIAQKHENKFFLLLILFLSIQNIDAQSIYFYSLEKKNNNFDSLVAAANNEAVDTVKAIKSYKIAATYFTRQDFGNYQKYLKQGLENSSNSPIYRDIGLYYQSLMNLTKPDAANILEKDFTNIESLLKKYKSSEAKRIRIIMFQNKALFRIMQNKEVESMNIITNQAIPLAKAIGDNELTGALYKSIGILFYNAKNYTKTIEYMGLVENFLNKLKKQTSQSKAIMGESLLLKADALIRESRMPEANTELGKTYSIIKDYPESNFYALYYCTLGYYYMKQKNYPEAIKLFATGLSNAEKYKNNTIAERIKLFEGQLNSELKEYEKSNTILKEVYKNTPYQGNKQEVLKELSKNYTALKDTTKSNLYAEQYINSFDSLNAVSIHKSIAVLEAKYRKSEKDKELAQKQLEISKKNKYMWILGFASLLSSCFIILGFLNFKKNKKISEQREINLQQTIKEIQQREELTLTKAILEGEERERARIAKDLHDGLGGMLAGVKINFSTWSSANLEADQHKDFHKILNQLDNSVTELRHVARNLMPESLLNFGLEAALKDLCEFYTRKDLTVIFQAINISKNTPLSVQLNVYRITQELLTNSVKHSEASNILLQCSQYDENLMITVEDNGKGFKEEDYRKSKSMGLYNLKNRIDYLKGKMEINSDDEGTIINIELNTNAVS